jgi:hypothetical protein
MLSDLWQRLHDTSPGQPTFLGALIGFLALLGGALFNAWLNRRRDDRLRREEQRAVATALRAELAGCREILLANAAAWNEWCDALRKRSTASSFIWKRCSIG